ncbi:MAG TPA: class I SAM-dependent methyltransferase [Candidatus Ratteibacteria bacterium]|nr:class I SAM-dependent methyltransferase [Candidatus Ratteibacteria bacterium]HRV03741.1 class I SAM-dependent methyltransferase [Candidatus Ratteibacteria bacterium]
MKPENEVLKDFYLLADYLEKKHKIKDSNKYKNNLSAFLLHANHIKSYDFVAPFCKDKRVLDIGCFIGYGESRIFSQAKEIIAIDSDDDAINFARNRSIPGVKFEKAEATSLPFLDDTFDIIIAFQLIEHIPPDEVETFLCQVRKILKKKGLLFITTPNRKFRLMPFQRPFNSEHYQEFTAKGLLRVLEKNFGNVQIKGIRAKKWIEEIERRRVRKSPLIKIKKHFEKIYSNIVNKKGNGEFNRLFQQFSMDDFYLEDQNLDKSMVLFAICEKNRYTE